MSIETTLVLFKKDAVERKLLGKIMERFERAGLTLEAMRMYVPKYHRTTLRAKMELHYSEEDIGARHGEAVRQQLIKHMCSGAVIAMAWSGICAVQQVRKLVGSTDPLEAKAGTIRGDFGADSLSMKQQSGETVNNLVHASSSPDEAIRELSIWFPSFTE